MCVTLNLIFFTHCRCCSRLKWFQYVQKTLNIQLYNFLHIVNGLVVDAALSLNLLNLSVGQ